MKKFRRIFSAVSIAKSAMSDAFCKSKMHIAKSKAIRNTMMHGKIAIFIPACNEEWTACPAVLLAKKESA